MNRNSCSASNELRLASCAWSRRYRMTSSLPRIRGGKHLHLSYSLPIATQASSQYLFRHFPPVGSSGTSLGALVASLPQFILPILRFAPVFFTAPFFIFSLYVFFLAACRGICTELVAFLIAFKLCNLHIRFSFPLLFLSRVSLQGGVALIAG